jgi:hypothetical protein
MARDLSTIKNRKKSMSTSIKTFAKNLCKVLLEHGIHAQVADRGNFVVWEDRAGKFNTATFGPYALGPLLIRLYWNIYPDSRWGRYRLPEGDRCELTFVPSELPPLVEEIAGCAVRGEYVRPYLFTAAAWLINPHHAPGVDRHDCPPFPWSWPSRED